MPGEPLVDGESIERSLRNAQLTPDELRLFCALVTLEAFSCRVTNEFFVDVVNTCTMVQRKLSDLESGQRFLALYEKHPDWGKPEKLMATYIDLCKEMMGLRNALADKLAKIAACPTPNDKIH